MASDDIWLSPFRASYRYVRVSRATGLEVGAIESFTGGSISRNQDTDTYESASLDYVGRLDVGNDFVRIYLDAEDPLTGASRTVCLGTFECSTPSRSVSGEVATGTATLYGRLHDLAKDDFDEPYAIPAGSNAVAAAREIAEGCGLEVVGGVGLRNRHHARQSRQQAGRGQPPARRRGVQGRHDRRLRPRALQAVPGACGQADRPRLLGG